MHLIFSIINSGYFYVKALIMIEEQLKIMIQLAITDGLIAEKEVRLIKKIGVANGIGEEEIQKMVEKPVTMGNISSLSDDQKFEYLYSVVQLMKADGQVFKSEIVFCETLAEKLGYKKEVVAEMSSRIYADPSITADREEIKAKVQNFLS